MRKIVGIAAAAIALCSLPAFAQARDDALPRADRKWQAQVAEAEKFGRDWSAFSGITTSDSTAEREKKLLKLLEKYDSHPIVPSIYIALGDLAAKEKPQKALDYYGLASTYPVASDLWSYKQQEATRKVAALYESRGEHSSAAAALSRWQISEMCGTGASYSEFRKQFKLWDLRMDYEPRDSVLSEIRAVLEARNQEMVYSFHEHSGEVGLRVRALYGPEHADQLEADVAAASSYLKDHPGENGYTTEAATAVLTEIQGQIDFTKAAAKASAAGLVRMTLDAEVRHETNVHGDLHRLRRPPLYDGGLWKSALLTDALKKSATQAVPEIMKGLDATPEGGVPNALLIYSLGRIGGTTAVNYLTAKAAREANVHSLKDYYYALLLTGDKGAARVVESAAAHYSPGKNNAAAAKYALDAVLGKFDYQEPWP